MFVQSKRAAEIAGLTEHQLKEWCMRRGLIRPDVLPRGRGNNALFGWQTLLALRLLALVHNKFGVSVAHCGPIMASLRTSLKETSFPGLYGQNAVYDGQRILISRALSPYLSQATLIIPLNEHLSAISQTLSHACPVDAYTPQG